jgi:hypothetical protein
VVLLYVGHYAVQHLNRYRHRAATGILHYCVLLVEFSDLTPILLMYLSPSLPKSRPPSDVVLARTASAL